LIPAPVSKLFLYRLLKGDRFFGAGVLVIDSLEENTFSFSVCTPESFT